MVHVVMAPELLSCGRRRRRVSLCIFHVSKLNRAIPNLNRPNLVSVFFYIEMLKKSLEKGFYVKDFHAVQ